MTIDPVVPASDAATFVFADLAGYTALTEAHGDDDAADAAAAFAASIRELLADYQAQEVKAIGDALMLRVPDAGRALHLAARIVEDLGARDRALGVRVGMHTGPAVRRGEDWFGAAVNVAARVADLAGGGEILMTEATREAAGAAVRSEQLRPRGQRELKHVRDPVDLYVLQPRADASRQLPIDPVCHMTIAPDGCEHRAVHRGIEYHFCSSACAEAFKQTPGRYTGRRASGASLLVSDQARERTARRLTRAYAKGRLDDEQLEQRAQQALTARTRADLKAITHDLPRRRRVAPRWLWPLWPLVIVLRRLRRVARARRARGRDAHRSA